MNMTRPNLTREVISSQQNYEVEHECRIDYETAKKNFQLDRINQLKSGVMDIFV